MANIKKSSALGELGAISGYMNQYEYASCILYNLMENGELEAITLCDPSAGIFDDLLIHSKGEIHATQVKTKNDISYILLGTELKADLVRSMAEAWQSLEKKFNTNAVRLTYIFAGLFSTSDTSCADSDYSGTRHSAELARFISRQDLTLEVIENSNWSAKLSELEKDSGLSSKDFVRFLNYLRLTDQQEILGNKIDQFPLVCRGEIEEIRNLLPVLVSEARPAQKWTEQELVDRLGWPHRLR